jgi:hypothetical protein
MSLGRLRLGELLTLGGAVCVLLSLFLPSYESPSGHLGAWSTFGPGVALLLAALCAALAMVISALTERSPALPVSTAVWCVPVGLAASIAAIVRVFERPDHASSLAVGGWLALIGALAILAGGWQALRDERPARYDRATPEARPRP